MKHATVLIPFLTLLLAIPVDAATDGRATRSWCATTPTGLAEAMGRHRAFERRLAREGAVAQRAADGSVRRLTATAAGPGVRKAGGVAVIDDDGTLIAQPNGFDLENGAVRFQRRRKRLRATPSTAAVSAEMGEKVTLGDDDTVVLDLPFGFRFYGQRYTRVFLNSDGNLTFGLGDNQSTPRSLARALSGPPRIAPLFVDLDPSVAGQGRGIFVDSTPQRVRITWFGVPEFGTANQNTFQVTLLPRGNVVFAYGDLDAREAIVGASPGGGTPVELLDLTAELPFGPSGRALLERFGTFQQVDDLAIAQVFFEHFRDVYDHLIVWLDFPIVLRGAFAFELNIKNQVEGIGLDTFDFTSAVGSDGRLESFVQMGSLVNYPADPGRTFLGTNSTLDLLGQEAGHRWLAFVLFRDAQGNASTRLLGRDFAHWSFHHDTDASVMEGNDFQDNGNGTFTTVAATDRFSFLDRYLMGLIPPAEVPDFYYLDNVQGLPPETAPSIGETLVGTRTDVSVDDVVAVEGPRVPASDDAPRVFKMAFVLLGRDGEPVSQESINQVNRVRRQWQGYFRQATGGTGTVRSRLRPLPN